MPMSDFGLQNPRRSRPSVRRSSPMEPQMGTDIGEGQGSGAFRRVGQGLVLARGQLAELAAGFECSGRVLPR